MARHGNRSRGWTGQSLALGTIGDRMDDSTDNDDDDDNNNK